MHATTASHRHMRHGRHGLSPLHPLKWLARAMATRRQRMRLDQLDNHLLLDIGIDRGAACREANRPFWDHP